MAKQGATGHQLPRRVLRAAVRGAAGEQGQLAARGADAPTLRDNHQRRVTDYQPPLVAAAYNAGGLHPSREGDDNPWRLRSTGDHVSRFCRFFGDACAVAAEDGWGRADEAA